MELRQLQYFRVIAEEEHFGRGSKRLRIAQPALSRQVRLLEEELGVELFHRLPRGVRLSAAGAVLLERCRELSGTLDRLVADTRAAAAGSIGTLRLGFIEVAAWRGVVPESIRLFRQSAPGVELSLSAMSSPAQISALRDGTLDAGLLYNPPQDGEFIGIVLARHDLVLAVPEEAALATRKSVRLADLAGQELIGFQRQASSRYHDELSTAFAARHFRPNTVTNVQSEADMLALVRAGVGYAFVNSCQRWRPPSGLAFLRVEDLDVALELTLVHRRDSAPPPLTLFVGLVKTLLDSAQV